MPTNATGTDRVATARSPAARSAERARGPRARVLACGAAATASGLLLWASSPAVGAGWLAWFALVPAAAVSLRAPGRAARLAVPLAYLVYLELLLVPAFPFGVTHRQWGDPALPVLVGESPVLAIALAGVPLFVLLLYALRFPYLAPRRDLPASGVLLVALPAAAFAALDLVRVLVDPSALWGPLFLTQAGGPAAALAELGGPWLVTLALAAANWALAVALLRRGRSLALPLAVGGLALAGVLLAPLLRGGEAGPSLRVAAIQPGYDTSEFELPVLRHFQPGGRDHELASLDLAADLALLTRDAARRGAKLVVWPEATLWVDPRTAPGVREALLGLAAGTGATVVVPYFLDDVDRGYAVAARPDGRLTEPQPKLRPMWFLGEESEDGREARPLQAAVPVGALLGVDNGGSAPARDLVAAGARILASGTHDWEELSPQQRAYAALHAAALRVPLVRADWRYGSAILDAGGRTVASAGEGKRRAAVVADVLLGSGSTPYARVGDAIGWAALGAAAMAALGARGAAALRRRASGSSSRRALSPSP